MLGSLRSPEPPPVAHARAGWTMGERQGRGETFCAWPSQAKCSAPLFNNQLGYTANLADSINQVLHRTAKGPPTDGRQPPPPPQAPSTALARILQ